MEVEKVKLNLIESLLKLELDFEYEKEVFVHQTNSGVYLFTYKTIHGSEESYEITHEYFCYITYLQEMQKKYSDEN